MKNSIQIVLVLLMAVSATSCKDFLDVNTDPNNPSEAPIEFVLPSAQASAAVFVGGSEMGNIGAFWAQYYTQSPDASQYRNIDSYNIQSDYADRSWQEIYAGGLNDFKYILENAEDNPSMFLISTVMTAYVYQYLVDVFDQVPYSEALRGEEGITQPAFDSGSDIYQDLLSRLDQALDNYQTADLPGDNPGGQDLLLGGDMDQWVRFANSLKLKLLMRMSYTSFADPTAVLDLVNSGNLITQDITMTQFADEESKRNPWYEIEKDRLNDNNHVASNSLMNFLKANDDIRISAIYLPSQDNDDFMGYDQGDFRNNDLGETELSKSNIGPTDPVYFMTVAEVYFLQAEALIRYAGGAGAKEKYEAGIDASFDARNRLGGSDLYGPGGPYEFTTTGVVEDDIRQVMLQKWVALANFQNLEAFIEINRTGYPEYTQGDPEPGQLTYSVNSVLAAGQAPQRIWIPDISRDRNANAPSQPVQGLTAKIWWDQK